MVVATAATMQQFGLIVSVVVLASLAGCGEVGPDSDCFERSTSEEFDNVSIRNTCSPKRLCESLQLQCPGYDEAVDCGPSEASVENHEALTCILDALADGENGELSWSTTAQDDPGWAVRSHRLWTVGANAYYAGSHRVDLGVRVDGVRFVKLRSRGAFANCRDESTDAKRLECVMDPWREVLGVVLEPGNG